MKYGLTESEYQFLVKNAVEPLQALDAKVYLFGSRANGKYKKFSDIDLLYVASADRKILAHEIYSIVSSLENSSFPFKVDLVSNDELAESYRTGVEKEKIEL
jgi:predicted nucleotidyltransferase